MTSESPSNKTRQRLKMSDIARIAGVSTSTVSRALSDHPSIPLATKREIQAIASEHDYVINRSAKSLRQSQTQTIAIAVPLGHEREQLISDPFFLRLFGHLADEITSRRYDVLLVRDPSPGADWLGQLIRSQRADGFIIVGQSDQHDALNRAAKSFPPMIVLGSQLSQQQYCSVGSDNFEGGRIATEHLLQSGRLHILFVGPAELPQIDRRLDGYRKALRDHGREFEEDLVLPAHFTGDSAFEQVREALHNGIKFDAIFAASDGIALSAIRAINATGRRCPEDISVVGFDDSDIALHASPPLSTVRQNLPELATTIVDLLFQRMSGIYTPSKTLPVQLVVRESSTSV